MTGWWQSWWQSLGSAPEASSRRQRWSVAIATLVVAITRVLAMSKTPWDWDEMLFMLALRDYDVAAHHPHPPGFPLFIGFAHVLRLVTGDDFRALQGIALAGALLVFPAAFLLARELRFSLGTSFAAALLLAFFPNVLFYGGTALSDVPSMALAIVACALLLRGCRSNRAYLGGAIALAIATGFRPQNLLIGCAPALIATVWRWRSDRRIVIVAITLGIAIVAVSYGAAIGETGWSDYRATVRAHQHYIETTDSFLSPQRRPLHRVFDEFFIRPWRQGMLNAIVSVLVVLAIVRRRPPVLIALAIFGPFCLFAWLFLDVHSASRFSLGYIPLFALLGADGLELIARRYTAIAGAALALVMFAWSWPAIGEVRNHASPPMAAVDWIRAHATPEQTTLYVDRRLLPFFEALAPSFAVMEADSVRVPVPWTEQRDAFFIREAPGELTFAREHGRLWDIARRRYFVASVTPLRERVAFGDGWYAQEGKPPNAPRWMSGRGVLRLPPVGGKGRLAISLHVPREVRGAAIAIRIDGTLVEAVRATEPYLDREYAIDGSRAAEVVIEIDRTLDAPGGDVRRLGLRLESLRWMGGDDPAG